ncbi:MAG: T9SS type A sorting domain-containing protein [Bacteroidetes bacterium]|nr:T9SS type A sorting domain-containing protein [Bacteroidota bacterium]
MKKLILLELAFLFLATTFSSNPPPPGWYQQTLPVSDNINDIFFLDSLNGWAVTQGGSTDTSFFLNTINGGANWTIQQGEFYNPSGLQLIDKMIGYSVGTSGGHGKIYKTTNGGTNWIIQNVLSQVGIFNDLAFANKDTGWVCSIDPFDGGLFKTTNGGVTWQRQLDASYKPNLVFFINSDTGWVSSTVSTGKLYRTTNGGLNWNFQFTSAFNIESIFFLNGKKGWMRGGPDLQGNGVSYTIDGGFTWISSTGNTSAGYDIKFINDSIGYTGMISNRIPKSIDGGKTWGYQTSPIEGNLSISFLRNDTLIGWAGGSGMVHTDDGGSLIVGIEESSANEFPGNFNLNQNYPNPFNPNTKISYDLRVTGHVTLTVFNITGKTVKQLVNKKQNPGNYNFEFNGEGLSSGIYFYRILITDEKSKNVFIETKKLILTK